MSSYFQCIFKTWNFPEINFPIKLFPAKIWLFKLAGSLLIIKNIKKDSFKIWLSLNTHFRFQNKTTKLLSSIIFYR